MSQNRLVRRVTAGARRHFEGLKVPQMKESENRTFRFPGSDKSGMDLFRAFSDQAL